MLQRKCIMRIFESPPALSFTRSILFLTPSYLFPHAEPQSSRSIHRYCSYVPSGWRNEVFRGLTKCQAVPSEGSAVLCTTGDKRAQRLAKVCAFSCDLCAKLKPLREKEMICLYVLLSREKNLFMSKTSFYLPKASMFRYKIVPLHFLR